MQRATRIRLTDFTTPPMRAFHMSWIAFFLCFFSWFAIAPLMGVVRDELHLTRDQIGWCMIGSVSITVFGRLLMGWLCDRIGPRLSYTILLLIAALPVMLIGLAHDYVSFLIFRISIGFIGASFVITQYHTSLMFAPNCVGTANATSAGWGNLGGGVTQVAMPALLAVLVTTLGLSSATSWRVCMVLCGVLCAVTGVAYYFLTQDTPAGNFSDLRRTGQMPAAKSTAGTFAEACRDPRVWALFMIYAACFGIELTINNMASLYFVDHFAWFQSMDSLQAMRFAGMLAGLHGLLNIFARTLGGVFGDRWGLKHGLQGRVRWLFAIVLCEGIALMAFSQARTLVLAIPLFILFSLCVEMACGATFAVVPFINPRALGSVAGIVGAGGNVGAVAAGFLFKTDAISWPTSLLILGVCVTAVSLLSLLVTRSVATASRPVEPSAAPLAPVVEAI